MAFVGTAFAQAQHNYLAWERLEISSGVVAYMSTLPEIPTARYTVVRGDAIQRTGKSEADLYYLMNHLGLRIAKSDGMKDLADGGIAVWGRARIKNGYQHFLAELSPAGATVFTSNASDFNLLDVASQFPKIIDLVPTGRYSARLNDAGIVLGGEPTALFRLNQQLRTGAVTPAAAAIESPTLARINTEAETNPNHIWPRTDGSAEFVAAEKVKLQFPGAIAPPPVKFEQRDGTVGIAMYRWRGNGYSPAEAENAPFLGQASYRRTIGTDIKDLFDRLYTEYNILTIRRSQPVRSSGWAAKGASYAAEVGDGTIDGLPVRFWADAHGSGEVYTVQLLYAPIETFKSWGGIVAPLAYNGYIADPENLPEDTRTYVKTLPIKEQAAAYVYLVDQSLREATAESAAASAGTLMQRINAVRAGEAGSFVAYFEAGP